MVTGYHELVQHMNVDASSIFSNFVLLDSSDHRIFTESTTKEGSFRQLAGTRVGDWLEVATFLDLLRRSSVASLQGGAISSWPHRNRRSLPATFGQHRCRIDRRVAD